MVASAIVLLAERGYQGTSFSEVLARSGAPRGSVYHHFPGGKDELVAAAVEQTFTDAEIALRAMHGLALEGVLERFCGWWRAVLEDGDCAKGCPLIAVSTGAGSASPLQGTVASTFLRWEQAIADALSSTPEVSRAGVDPGGAAVFLLGALQGALAYGRATRSLERFDVISRSVRASVPPLLGL